MIAEYMILIGFGVNRAVSSARGGGGMSCMQKTTRKANMMAASGQRQHTYIFRVVRLERSLTVSNRPDMDLTAITNPIPIISRFSMPYNLDSAAVIQP